jgi:lantibiotic modifying enzyme
LLEAAAHPSLQSSSRRQSAFLTSALKADVPTDSLLARLAPSGKRDLRRGDVPIFYARANAKDLICSNGDVVPDAFAVSGFELMLQRLRQLGYADLDVQKDFIDASLTPRADE